jgi:protein-S-isoprenylcysteine O-methyltransferase Ste14
MEQERKHGPGVWFAPPAIFALAFLAGLWLEMEVYRIRMLGDLPMAARVVAGSTLMAAGLALMLWAFIEFRRAKTTVMPFRESSVLVPHGPYRFSRNPIYVGDILVHIGLAVALNAGWPVILLPVVIAVVRYYVIGREEEYLSRTFGPAYDAYRQSVRRWI